ncbi:MAG: metal ABC transporter substrate-binding protein [Clostridiales Family XIII bacterium]|jgi:zinc transport system substrate-binding protein|nr:metal ABC transporter substrate-binding protein [Clostridiales Family XIII bacterium]
MNRIGHTGKHAKKILFLALALLLALSAAGCGQGGATGDSGGGAAAVDGGDGAGNERVSIVATIFPPYDLARAVSGGLADVSMLLPPASESHSFEPTTRDIISIQDCDLFLYIGGESDEWVDGILESMDTSSMRVLPMMDSVATVEEEIVEGMQEEEEELALAEEEEVEYDEHIWTYPGNAKLMLEAITEALCEIDGANAPAYRENAEAYSAQLDELDAAFQDLVAEAPLKTVVFGDRFPFRYFADAYGLDYFAAFPGCSTETEASAATVAFLIDKIKEEGIPVIFHIELSNGRMAEAIGEATGAKPMLLHACHNISKDDFESGLTYIDLMWGNVDSLKEALS